MSGSNFFDLFFHSLSEPKYLQQKCCTQEEKKYDEFKENARDIFDEDEWISREA